MSDRIDEYYREQRERAMALERADARQGVAPPEREATAAPAQPASEQAATYAQAQREHAERRGMYCLTCGYDLRGIHAGVCPECGRPFNAHDAATFTIHPPMAPTWGELYPKGPPALWLSAMLLVGTLLGWGLLWAGPGGGLILLLIYPFWIGAMVWNVLRLARNDHLDGLLFQLPVGAAAGLALGLLTGFLFTGLTGWYFGSYITGFTVVASVSIGVFAGLIREFTDLAEMVG